MVTEPTGTGVGGDAGPGPSSQGHEGSRFPTAADWERWGVDPAWSTWITVSGHRWHLLDTRAPQPAEPSGVLGAEGGGIRNAARPESDGRANAGDLGAVGGGSRDAARPESAGSGSPERPGDLGAVGGGIRDAARPESDGRASTRDLGADGGGIRDVARPELEGIGPTDGAVRVVCVHGNPTWGILWQPILRRLGDRFHVVAPDQLGMGWSQRTDHPRRYAERVADLGELIEALDERDGERPPILLVAHDWGGAIAMGWAVDHQDRVAGLVLTNTGIAVPAGRRAPGIIRLAASRGVLATVCRRTSIFVRGTAWLSRGRTPAWFREALMAPYRRAVDRAAIEGFVADVPFDDAHPSAADVAAVAGRLHELDVPVLLAWGAGDPVFDDDFADDLAARFRHASIHRFAGANHLVPVDEDLASLVEDWLEDLERRERLDGLDGLPGRSPSSPDPSLPVSLPVSDTEPVTDPAPAFRPVSDVDPVSDTESDAEVQPAVVSAFRPVWAGLEERADDDTIAFHDGASGRSVTFRELNVLVRQIGTRLRSAGVQPGDRIALLVPPSVELVAVVYACWRVGAVTVIADRGLGLGGLGKAIRGARVSWVLGPRPARVAATTLRWAPRATALALEDLVDDSSEGTALPAGPIDSGSGTDPAAGGSAGPVAGGSTGPVAGGSADLVASGSTGPVASDDVGPATSVELGAGPGPEDPLAVLFTSGATGPAKGVRYRHRQLAAQRDALAATYSIGPDDRFVAAFAPFALYGPALGIASAVPDVDVTRPGALTADALDRSCAAIDATMVFASPAALANVVATAGAAASGSALAQVRTVMSAGAPVPVTTLRAVARLTPDATLHTPYGMTECLPVADLDLVGIEAALAGAGVEIGRGVCVGPPVDGCEVRVATIGFDAGRTLEPGLPAAATGELLVRAPWCSDGYDRRWQTERTARPVDDGGVTWHRTGDVGHVDELGRVWVEGRSAHVIHAAGGPVTPVPVEVAAESVEGVRRAAAVGVGPNGLQQLVVVVELDGSDAGPGRGPVRGSGRRTGRGSGLAVADGELADAVRAAVVAATGRPVAAVCVTGALPVDIRHNAKIDRTAVAVAASKLLAGG